MFLTARSKIRDNASIDIARYLWSDIEEADRIEDLGEKWGIDAKALSSRLREMPYCQKCAIIEVVSRFWLGNDRQEWESDEERFIYFGAKIKE